MEMDCILSQRDVLLQSGETQTLPAQWAVTLISWVQLKGYVNGWENKIPYLCVNIINKPWVAVEGQILANLLANFQKYFVNRHCSKMNFLFSHFQSLISISNSDLVD